MSEFKPAFERLMRDEGGWFDDPRGGPTNRGLTQKFLDDRGIKKRVQDLTLDETAAIYLEHVWEEYRIGQFADQDLASEYFNMAVLSGPSPATKCLQRALCAAAKNPSLLKDDGVLGPITRRQVNLARVCCLQAAFRSEQAGYLRDIDDPVNERGWVRRAYR
jgi:lysozyme family protein